ncbi:hypothetical protein C6Q28_10670 [Burkholderia multivorans]|uniref:Bacteriophage protein n=1 Tax=Burkholderia multivorans (strain ATCC 17616 / 249) TaxID=395019 RepID=A0A0H3KN93_BURM1|nr:gp24 [Burkholderia phage Bcep176]ABA60025.1 gp24 [Burkholderia phage Bcep176]PRF62432.1 hypothetical protein C6Q28_10670 [Burkholderia multivorans]BAG46513.1 bacteriophage protein [Burkholderia multivorans ATCC 17616]
MGCFPGQTTAREPDANARDRPLPITRRSIVQRSRRKGARPPGEPNAMRSGWQLSGSPLERPPGRFRDH